MLNIHIHRINHKHLAKASLDKERASVKRRGAWEPIGDPCSHKAYSSATVRGLRSTSPTSLVLYTGTHEQHDEV